MIISCSKGDLLQGVNIAMKAVSQKNTLSILECIVITAEQGEIKLTSNNMELGIETIIEGTIKEEGVIALDAKIFSEIVRKLPDNEVTIQADANLKTTIVCEKAKFDIMGKSGDDFSYLPTIERRESISISQFTLKEIIRQTIFSVAAAENNMVMTGELFEIKDDILKVVSLDGHRISARKVHLKDNYPYKKVIVPGKTLSEISKIIAGDADKMVEIFFTANHIAFIFDQTTVVSRLIEGEYLNIDRMISTDYETKVTVKKKELLDCIDRASLLARESDKKPIVMNFTDDIAELKMVSAIGRLEEEIEIEKQGRNLMIGFNPNFFIDALRVIDDEEITLYMINQKAPCIIKDENDSYIYLILPINFSNAAN